MESTQSKLYEIEDSAGRKTDVYNVADVDNIDYNNENQKLRIEMSKSLFDNLCTAFRRGRQQKHGTRLWRSV